MANLLPVFVLGVSLTMKFVLREFPALPSQMSYVPDLVIGLASIVIVARLVAMKSWARIPLRYLLVFALFVYAAIAGYVLNDVSPDTAFAGIRNYFKYIPIFLLPLAFRYTDGDLHLQARFFLAFMAMQIPLTLWQRFVQYDSVFTGDKITGTFSTSTSIAIVCASGIVALSAFYLDKRIRPFPAAVLGVMLLVPAALSETKATPILIVGGALAVVFLRRKQIELRRLAIAGTAVFSLLTAFVFVYDQLYTREDGSGFLDLMTSKERMLDNYNYKGIKAEDFAIAREQPSVIVGQAERLTQEREPLRAGRIDSVLLPFDALLPEETVRFFFGLGIGNMDSSFGSGGAYLEVKNQLGGSQTTLSMLLWETGLAGCIAFCVFIALILRDAAWLGSRSGASSTLGAAEFGVAAIWGVCLLYANLFHLSEVLILLVYGAGLIVSRAQSAQASQTVALHAMPMPERLA